MRLRQFKLWHPILFALGSGGLIFFLVVMIPLGPIIFHGNTHHAYSFLFPTEQITSIQLVEIQDGIDLYSYFVDDIPAMLMDSTGSPFDLEQAAFASFLNNFSTVPCHRWVNDPCPQIVDGTILITYSDGSMEWICAAGTFYHDHTAGKSSMTWFYFDDDSFTQLLQSYGFY